MKLIAAANPVPGLSDIFNANPVASKFTKLGDVISGLLNIIFYVVVFVAFYFLIWGAFNYIMAQGKKEDLAKARDRITWALIGLMVVLLAYFIAKFVTELLKTNTQGGVPF